MTITCAEKYYDYLLMTVLIVVIYIQNLTLIFVVLHFHNQGTRFADFTNMKHRELHKTF
jgi:hypothetical protein